MDDTTELYCDNCGDSTLKVEMHHYDSLPWPIESANEGESGSVCKACITDLTSEHEERPVMAPREEALKAAYKALSTAYADAEAICNDEIDRINKKYPGMTREEALKNAAAALKDAHDAANDVYTATQDAIYDAAKDSGNENHDSVLDAYEAAEEAVAAACKAADDTYEDGIARINKERL